MSRKGLPVTVAMRHDSHYVEELSKPNKTIGKVIAINLLEPNPEQPRVELGSLEELSDSIREKGILEPILVKPDKLNGSYLIIAGERRWRAAQLAGLREVPCIELDLDEQSIAEIALIENLQRKDLTVWEEADGLAALREKFGYKHDDIAKKISKSRSTVTELLSISGIPPEIRVKCRAQNLNSKSNLLEVARQFDEHSMKQYLDDLSNKKIQPKKPKTDFSGSPGGANPYAGENVKKIESEREKNRRGDSSEKNPENVSENLFTYNSGDNNFNLSIRFGNHDSYDKKSVLRALKEAFDEVKSGYLD